MKFYNQIIIILVIFFKTETLFSNNNLFNVNNIELEKKEKTSNNDLANQAIKKGFNQLITRILLDEDKVKLSNLNFASIKQLVTYYQITNLPDNRDKEKLVNFSVTFDKDKIHNLFYKKGILYSEILDKELFILPILVKENEIFVFNNNFFYKNWNEYYQNDLIEFVLPLENIEIIKNINDFKNNLIDLNLVKIFQEYSDKNLAFIIIEDNRNNNKRAYVKAIIQGKKVSKNLIIKKEESLNLNQFNEKIITEVKKELINLIKSKNLIDIRAPSFINVKLDISKKSNLVVLNSRIKNIDSIENIYVQEFNKDYMNLRIKYFGKLEKIIIQLKKENIDLQMNNDEWTIKTL